MFRGGYSSCDAAGRLNESSDAKPALESREDSQLQRGSSAGSRLKSETPPHLQVVGRTLMQPDSLCSGKKSLLEIIPGSKHGKQNGGDQVEGQIRMQGRSSRVMRTPERALPATRRALWPIQPIFSFALVFHPSFHSIPSFFCGYRFAKVGPSSTGQHCYRFHS